MTEQKEIRWKIDGIYTAETMPLGRLADYLKELSVMLGENKNIHLVKVESSSTVPVFKVDLDASDSIRRRAIDVRNGVAPQSALKSYAKINKMLIEDKGTGTLYDGTAEIIPFPGFRKEDAIISGIKQHGTLDGKLIKVGGLHSFVPVQILPDDDGEIIAGVYARRSLSQEMGKHLYTPVRLYGRGQWTRDKTGRWLVEKFMVDNFEPLAAITLPEAVAELRGIKADWGPHPIASLKAMQYQSGEDD